MKTIKYTLLWISLTLCIPGISQLYIDTGTTLKAEDTGTITLENINLQNEGTLNAENITFLFKEVNGTQDQTIGGNGSTVFNHVTLQLPTQDLRLDTDIQIDGTIDFQEGHFNLNNHNVTLGENAMIQGEESSSCFIGANGGEIIMNLSLNAPSNANPANLGAVITSTANLGMTEIRRGHQAQSYNGNTGIYRFYDISPTNNSGLNATLRFYYMDGELNSIPENELELWRDAGSGWGNMGFSSRDASNNYIELNGIDAFSKWTATNQANALPLEFLYFEANKLEEKTSLLKWETSHELNNEGFEIQRSVGDIPFSDPEWEVLGFVEGKGSFEGINTYEFIDEKPAPGFNYYRLKQLDWNGNYSYSPIELVAFEVAENIRVGAIFPNPLSNQNFVEIPIYSSTPIEAELLIFDARGKLLMERKLSLGNGNHLIKMEGLNLPAGVYPLKIGIGGELFLKRIVIQ